MKNIALLLLLLPSFKPSSFSQRVIEVKHEQDSQGNYNFSCTNRAYCNYILEINFTSLDNAKPDQPLPYQAVVKPGSNKLFKLSKENAANPIQFKYQIGYFKGCLSPTVDSEFTYLLPISPGKEAQAYEVQNRTKPVAGDPESKNWYSVRLRMKPGDTLYAARRGIITEVDVSSNLNDSGVASVGSGNYIEIVHGDCSFGHYGVLKKNSSFVRPGQLVQAGEPIGLIGGDRYGRGSEVRFSVSYNQTQDISQKSGGKNGEISWVYVPLKFWTKINGKGMLKHGASYISEYPESIITQEMTKLELKKRKATRKINK
jgi:hypothetical protein